MLLSQDYVVSGVEGAGWDLVRGIDYVQVEEVIEVLKSALRVPIGDFSIDLPEAKVLHRVQPTIDLENVACSIISRKNLGQAQIQLYLNICTEGYLRVAQLVCHTVPKH